MGEVSRNGLRTELLG